jgi:hypothetical protein
MFLLAHGFSTCPCSPVSWAYDEAEHHDGEHMVEESCSSVAA